jgi:hypothetical protein
MKSRTLTVALAAALLIVLSPAAKADGPITIGLNGAGTLSRNANVSWVRTGDYWANINPSSGVFNFGNADNIVNQALSQGQQVLFILSGAPVWCGGASNGNTPCDIESWKTFVDQTSQHLAGRIGAYEIWNEPDLQNNGTYGVGWDMDVNTYPRYVDYMVEAAQIIHRNDPSAKVVGGVFSGKPNSRTVSMIQQFQNVSYFGITASDYVDVISCHQDNLDACYSQSAARYVEENVLNYIAAYNPNSRYKEMWITEFSWRSADIGEDTQRIRLKDFLIEMTGGGYGYLSGWNFTQGFIYVTESCDTSRSVYYCDGYDTPKLVVTNYLQPLGFPAIQQPGVPRE